MIHHVTLWVPDIERAARPWTWLMGELGCTVERPRDGLIVLRHPTGAVVVLEQSPDMVPGMLYSRLRPGLNHLAFVVEPPVGIAELAAAAPEHGWTRLSFELHPVATEAEVVYLEDSDGFEVELVAAAGDDDNKP